MSADTLFLLHTVTSLCKQWILAMTSPHINRAALEHTPSSDAIYSAVGMECSDLLPMSAKEESPLPEISNENKTQKA